MKERKFDKVFNVFNICFLTIVAIITILPLYYLLIISITDPTEYLMTQGRILVPHKLSFDAYAYIFSTRSYRNSLMVSSFLATVGTLLSLMTTAAFAYGLSKKRLYGRKLLLLLVLFTILFQPGIIPNYLLIHNLKLINNIWALILPGLTNGFYVILMKSFFESIPQELEEAAIIEGCSDVHIFFRIILPCSYASLAAFGLFYAVGYWNSYFNAVMYITDSNKWPLQIFLRNIIIESATSDMGDASDKMIPAMSIKMAAVVTATLPILMVYPFLQKHFTKGVMLGSVKG